MQVSDVTIHTLWSNAFTQCELVFLGLHGYRLRLWVRGALMLDEDVLDVDDATRRAAELSVEWSRFAG